MWEESVEERWTSGLLSLVSVSVLLLFPCHLLLELLSVDVVDLVQHRLQSLLCQTLLLEVCRHACHTAQNRQNRLQHKTVRTDYSTKLQEQITAQNSQNRLQHKTPRTDYSTELSDYSTELSKQITAQNSQNRLQHRTLKTDYSTELSDYST